MTGAGITATDHAPRVGPEIKTGDADQAIAVPNEPDAGLHRSVGLLIVLAGTDAETIALAVTGLMVTGLAGIALAVTDLMATDLMATDLAGIVLETIAPEASGPGTTARETSDRAPTAIHPGPANHSGKNRL